MQVHLPGKVIKNVTDPNHCGTCQDGHLTICIPLAFKEISIIKAALDKENSVLSADNSDKISANNSIKAKLDEVTPT